MYSVVTTVNNTGLYTWKVLIEQILKLPQGEKIVTIYGDRC